MKKVSFVSIVIGLSLVSTSVFAVPTAATGLNTANVTVKADQEQATNDSRDGLEVAMGEGGR